jgi:3-deoxy-D-manno-octulosonic-acid transferase
MRSVYAATWLIATPFVIARLAWRARKQPGYLAHLGERFGRYREAPAAPRIWIHAVSVGETRAAALVIAQLQKRFPAHRILLTHMTPTGRETGIALLGDRVERAWLPYDLGFAVRGFFAHFRPAFGVILETEVWPRLLDEAARARIPVVLANARLSERSARRYARLPALARWAFGSLAGVAAQGADDARRLEALGAPKPAVLGNVKFDVDVPDAMLELGARLRGRVEGARAVWVAGSTREGEEALLLDALGAMPRGERALLVIVPRHPQRFDEVAAFARSKGFSVARRSDERTIGRGIDVVVGDSMGEMLAYYAMADVVIVGGSLLDYGAQNLIEAAAAGRPAIVGPSTYNFAEATREAIAAGAALAVHTAAEALEAARRISADPALMRDMGEKARAFVAKHRGAVDRLAAWIEEKVSGAPPG